MLVCAVVAARVVLMIAMSVATMAAVSEQVHERTSEQKEVRQETEYVRAMLGEKEKSRDGPEGNKYPTASRSPKRIPRIDFSCHMNPLCTRSWPRDPGEPGKTRPDPHFAAWLVSRAGLRTDFFAACFFGACACSSW